MFDFRLEPEIGLLTVTRTGVWSLATVASYEAVLRQQLAILQQCGPSTAFIIDIRATGSQSRIVAIALQKMVGRLGPLHATRTAVVTFSGLAKLQAMRIADIDAQVFSSMSAARDWLMGNEAAAHALAEVHDDASEADAEGRAVRVRGPSDVDVTLTPVAALETAKRIGNAAVEALLAPPAVPPVLEARTARRRS
jgi:hypothetical protein